MKCKDCGLDFDYNLLEERCDGCWEKYWKKQAEEDKKIGNAANMVRY